MLPDETAKFEISMKELNNYCENFKKMYGPIREYPEKTHFDPKVHFEPASIHSLDVDTSIIKID